MRNDIEIHLPLQVHGENQYGELILLQEYPNLEAGEEYVRVFVKKENAEDLARQVLAWTKSKGSRVE